MGNDQIKKYNPIKFDHEKQMCDYREKWKQGSVEFYT